MKTIILGVVTAVLLTVNAQADNGGDWYIGTNYGVTNSMDDGYFGGLESVGNVVGEKSSIRSEIEIGSYNSSNYRPMNAFIYKWQYDEFKNYESGYGIGAKMGFRVDNFERNIFSFGAKGGIGSQQTNGKTFMTKNGLTNVSYATLSNGVGARPAVFTKDTDVIEIDLIVGYTFEVCKNFNISANIDYIYSNYAIAYHLKNGNVFLGGITQDTLYFNTSLKIIF